MAILGIDEVGRGPWAGPLVIGAVILPDPKPDWVQDLRDSKKLSPKKREKLSTLILAEATASGLGWVSSTEIDQIGLSEALNLATRRALKSLPKTAKFSQIIIDGNRNFLAGTPIENRVSTLVKADDAIKEVAAASIIAKVARDGFMCKLAEKYPGYSFEKHKGYGTAAHRTALEKLGPCPEHRQSFAPVAKITGTSDASEYNTTSTKPSTHVKNTTAIGSQAETAAANYLTRDGHAIIACNFKTKRCEIDIISIKDQRIYFTEVKYRQNDTRGGGLAAVTPNKKQQMTFAAEIFLTKNPKFRTFEPRLTVISVTGPEFAIEDYLELTE